MDPHVARIGKQLLVVSNDAGRSQQMARVLSALGYEAEVCEPAKASWHCRQRVPHAVVLATASGSNSGLPQGLGEVKALQRQGRLPPFPIVSAGDPADEAVASLVDGIVLEPERLTSLATEISKQVDGTA